MLILSLDFIIVRNNAKLKTYIMQETKIRRSRKSFLLWATAVLGSLTALRMFRPKPQQDKIVMLTEDGKLVEIDSNLLKSGARKVTNPELQAWVKSRPSKP
jgi:hypothetical protein